MFYRGVLAAAAAVFACVPAMGATTTLTFAGSPCCQNQYLSNSFPVSGVVLNPGDSLDVTINFNVPVEIEDHYAARIFTAVSAAPTGAMFVGTFTSELLDPSRESPFATSGNASGFFGLGASLTGFLQAITDGRITFSGLHQVFTLGGDQQLTVQNVALNIGVVPEPATWAMMIAGFGLVGAGVRRRRLLLA